MTRPAVPRSTYIHGTAAAEQERLIALNRLTNDAFIRFLDPAPGDRVLEVGSGLGILAAGVASAAEVRVVGVELSAAQVARSPRGVRTDYVQGDAHALSFGDGVFDLVYARYVLEHVADPGAVLAEMRRVLRPGGRVAVTENDVSLLRLDPPCPSFNVVGDAFAKLQRDLGGDGLIGRRLFGLFHRAGFRAIELSVQPEVHWAGSPNWWSWVQNIIGNVESARSALVDQGLASASAIDRAVAELAELAGRSDGSSVFVWNRARAVK